MSSGLPQLGACCCDEGFKQLAILGYVPWLGDEYSRIIDAVVTDIRNPNFNLYRRWKTVTKTTTLMDSRYTVTVRAQWNIFGRFWDFTRTWNPSRGAVEAEFARIAALPCGPFSGGPRNADVDFTEFAIYAAGDVSDPRCHHTEPMWLESYRLTDPMFVEDVAAEMSLALNAQSFDPIPQNGAVLLLWNLVLSRLDALPVLPAVYGTLVPSSRVYGLFAERPQVAFRDDLPPGNDVIAQRAWELPTMDLIFGPSHSSDHYTVEDYLPEHVVFESRNLITQSQFCKIDFAQAPIPGFATPPDFQYDPDHAIGRFPEWNEPAQGACGRINSLGGTLLREPPFWGTSLGELKLPSLAFPCCQI